MQKVEKCLEKNINKIITTFIWIQPIIDVLTAIMLHNNMSFTIGIIIRIAFLLFMVFYLLISTKNKKKYLIYLSVTFIYILLFMINTITQKGIESIWYELQNTFKCFYFPIMFICIYNCYKRSKKDICKMLSNLFVIYLLFILIPNVLNLGFGSYEITKKGSIGWFYTANEVGAIISILMPFYLNEIINKKNKPIIFLSIIIIFYTLTTMGTKGPLLSFGIILIYYFIKYYKKIIKEKKYKTLGIMTTSFIIVILALMMIIPKTTFYKNIIIHLDFLKVEKISDFKNPKIIDHFIFSQRLTFLNNTVKIYNKSPISSKLLGVGYIDNYGTDQVSMKMIEMDYFDILFRQGIIGIVIIFGGIVMTINKKKRTKKINDVYLLSLFLSIILALLTGHVITSPSVSIYVALIIDLIYNGNIKEIENDKTRVCNC